MIQRCVIAMRASVDWNVTTSVPADPTLPALIASVTAALKAGVGNTAKRKGALVCSTQIVPGVVHATALLKHATATRVGPGGDVKNPLALAHPCVAATGNARPLGILHSVPVTRGGWVELARPNVSMVHRKKQMMVLMFAIAMGATVI